MTGDVYYRRGFDHVKTIARALQNLRGAGALANELIQNADDAEAATELTFRFTKTELEVIDNGGFESCGHLGDETCRWEASRRRNVKKRCDFHAFQQLAGASKDDDPNLAGAFGVGFLSVYQVTDQPELISAGQHWIIDETRNEGERIRGCGGCSKSHDSPGTRFILPWAGEMTPLRALLLSDPVTTAGRERLYEAFCDAAPRAMVFLRKLTAITIEHHGHLPRTFQRAESDGVVSVTGPGCEERWRIFAGEFDEAADELAADHPQIGERSRTVRVAARPGPGVKGLLYATLPTQIRTGLPVHVDASFYPRLDRKGILLEGHEGEWNRAAISCAADLVANNLEGLESTLGTKGLWRLVRDAYDGRARKRRGASDSQTVFWDAIHRELGAARVMPASGGGLRRVDETVLPARGDPPDWLALLGDLGIPTVAEALHRLIGDMRRAVPTATLTVDRVVHALIGAGLDGGPFDSGALPVGLSAAKRRNMLRRQLAEMVAAGDGPARDGIRSLALWRTTKRSYDSFASSYLVARDTARLFGAAIGVPLIDREAQDVACQPLLEMGDEWDASLGLDALVTNSEMLPTNEGQARQTIDWLAARESLFTATALQRLHERAIVPTKLGVRTPAISVIPGGFVDPLHVAAEVIDDVARANRSVLAKLGVERLSFVGYLKGVFPRALHEAVCTEGLLELVRIAVDHRREIDADSEALEVLGTSAWLPCTDQQRRAPSSVYFDTEGVRAVLRDRAPLLDPRIGREGGVGDLLRALGVCERPRPEDVVRRVEELVAEPVDDARVMAVLDVLRHVASARSDLTAEGSLGSLRSIEWLPIDSSRWGAPSATFFTRERPLFETTGTFLAFSRADQDELREALAGLGVRRVPPVGLVVSHITNLVDAGERPDRRIAQWLNSDRHWDDPAVEELRDVAWLATADDALAKPCDVFRVEHDFVPYLQVLDRPLRAFSDVLNALDVPMEPDASDAVGLLLELAADAGTEDPVASDRRRVLRACWRLLARDPESDVESLSGQEVALGSDNRLYRCDQLLVDDLPHVGREFPEPIRARLIRQGDGHSALRRAGVRDLSRCIRSRVVDTGAVVDGSRVSNRIAGRQRQLARVVGAEGGVWTELLEFARSLDVEGFESVTVDRYLDVLGESATTPSVAVLAHWLGDGRMVVAIQGGRPDWFEIASVLRDVLCPTGSPAAASAIKDILAAETGLLAHERVSRLGYPELDDDDWNDLQLAVEEQRVRAEQAAAAAEESDEREVDWGNSGPEDGDESSEDDLLVAAPSDEAPVSDEGPSAGADERQRAGDSGDALAGGEATSDGPDGDSHDVGGAGSDDLPDHGGESSGRQHERTRSTAAGAKGRGSGSVSAAGGSRRSSSSAEPSSWWYVIVSGQGSDDGVADDVFEAARAAGRRTSIDRAGMAAVERHESLAGRTPEAQLPNNPGFDIKSRNRAGETLRLIEVKSLAGEWGPGGFPKLTPTQWEMALAKPERYWLYVVEYAESDEPVLTRIQDPAGAATRYAVDPGWLTLGETDDDGSGSERE